MTSTHARPAAAPTWAATCLLRLRRGFVALLALGAALGALPARAAATTTGPDADMPAAPGSGARVLLNHRPIVEFRSSLVGDTPEERAAMAQAALNEAVARRGPGVVTRATLDEAVRFDVDGDPVFYLALGDISGPRSAVMLQTAAQKVERRLVLALKETREATDPRQLAIGLGWSGAATVAALLLFRGLIWLRDQLGRRLHARLGGWASRHAGGVLSTWLPHVDSIASAAGHLLRWALIVLLLDLWATFVLQQFAYTRPWGERSTNWLLGLLEGFVFAILSAVPGLLTALLIFLLARGLVRGLDLLLQRVQRGELHLGWLDADTAFPTRRIGAAVVWLFALALAYPYLPGASSDSFKGVTVLAGLMLSMGASGVVGQAMSGLSLMYSRMLRVGEYVRIGESEGTVTEIGLFATRLQTGLGEELSLPNTVIVGQPVRNYSRLAPGARFVLHTTVTIGYATPWRQVHAMLLEAARRTPGIAAEPPPYVVQTALSDFYAEYRLCAQADRSAPQRRAEAMNRLHGHIQDVFSENGVPIMSPHYIADPTEAQVMTPGPWFTPRAEGAVTPPRPDPAG